MPLALHSGSLFIGPARVLTSVLPASIHARSPRIFLLRQIHFVIVRAYRGRRQAGRSSVSRYLYPLIPQPLDTRFQSGRRLHRIITSRSKLVGKGNCSFISTVWSFVSSYFANRVKSATTADENVNLVQWKVMEGCRSENFVEKRASNNSGNSCCLAVVCTLKYFTQENQQSIA